IRDYIASIWIAISVPHIGLCKLKVLPLCILKLIVFEIKTAMYTVIGCFIINCRYLRIKYRRQMRRIQKLVDKIYSIQKRSKNAYSADKLAKRLTYLQKSYFRSNRAIHKLCNEITAN